MLMHDSGPMKFDRDVFGKEIWACVEIGGSLVNFQHKTSVFIPRIRRLSKRESNLLFSYVHTHISSHAIKALSRHGQS